MRHGADSVTLVGPWRDLCGICVRDLDTHQSIPEVWKSTGPTSPLIPVFGAVWRRPLGWRGRRPAAAVDERL